MDLDRTLIIGPVRNSQRLRIPPLPAETEVNIMPAAELIRELVAPTSEVIPGAQVLDPKPTFITKPRRPLDGSDRLARAIEEQNRLVEHAQWKSELQLLINHAAAQKLGPIPTVSAQQTEQPSEPLTANTHPDINGAHTRYVTKLTTHIEAAKKTGIGFKSKAEFLRSLNNGRGVDRQSLYRWEKCKPTLTPGHAGLIEAAIDKFPK